METENKLYGYYSATAARLWGFKIVINEHHASVMITALCSSEGVMNNSYKWEDKIYHGWIPNPYEQISFDGEQSEYDRLIDDLCDDEDACPPEEENCNDYDY